MTAQQSADSVSPEDALAMRDKATSRLTELEDLDNTSEVSVPDSTLRTIRNRITSGQNAFDRAEYEQAREHWSVAREQARVALKRGYLERARILTNASGAYLSDRRAAGYTSPRLQTLEERQQALVESLEEVETVEEAQSAEERAVALHEEVQALPAMQQVKIASWLASHPLLSRLGLVGGLVIAVAFGAGLHRLLGPSPAPQEEMGEETDRDLGSTLNSQSNRR
jgi:hypothetical protein